MSKIMLKRLTDSDLTWFESIYRARRNSNQKAINLNANPFVTAFFPGLQGSRPSSEQFTVDVHIFGPDGKDGHNMQRKVLPKTLRQKNWRLDGEFVHDPVDDPGRYELLAQGDLAVLEFSGDRIPVAVQILLIRAGGEPAFHERLERRIGVASAVAISAEQLLETAAEAGLDENHPAWLLGGGTQAVFDEGLPLLPVAGVRPRISRDRARAAVTDSALTGDRGEELVNEWLQRLLEEGAISGFEWVAIDDAFAPMDFVVRDRTISEELLDAKTTTGPHETHFHLSVPQLRQAAEGERFSIVRVSQLEVSDAYVSGRLREATVDPTWARAILAVLDQLDGFVSVGSVQVDPAGMRWGAEWVEHVEWG